MAAPTALLTMFDAREFLGMGHSEPATHYYRVMTRSERMPVFIGEHI